MPRESLAGGRIKPDCKEVNRILWIPVWAIGRSSTYLLPACSEGPSDGQMENGPGEIQ